MTDERRLLVIFGAATLVVAVLLLWLAPQVVLLSFAAVLVAVFLSGPTRLLVRYTPLSTRLALAVVALVLVGISALAFTLLGPNLVSQVVTFSEQLPASLERIRAQLSEQEWGRTVLSIMPQPEDLAGRATQLVGGLTRVVTSTIGVLTSGLVIALVGLYLAAAPDLYHHAVITLIPVKKRDRGAEILAALSRALGWWLVGRMTSMAVVGMLTLIGLLIIGVPLAVTLALIAALLSFIPNLGPVISAVPAVIIAFAQSPRDGLWVIALYIAIQTVESYAITPLIERKAVDLLPAFLLIMQILFGVLFGLFGLVLASPLAVALTVLIQMIYVQDALQDDVHVLGSR
jgi:predicted PurR-regulated permease PerM